MKKISVCINLDTLALGTDWKLSPIKDPTYKLVDERLIGRLEKAGFKATLFVVGKDLEAVQNREFVKKWSLAGHEIGNHSYSHPLNLASFTREEIEIEIEKTDGFIIKVTGRKPRSFNAPGWALSPAIDRVLLDLGYKADYSPFPSWWIYPLLSKQWWSLRKEKIASTVWRRRDILYPFSYKLWPASTNKKIRKVPLPTVGWTSIPVWHTGWFILGEKIFPKMLKQAIEENPGFYYLMHPADVISLDDIPIYFADRIIFERLNISLKDKIKYFDSALQLLA